MARLIKIFKRTAGLAVSVAVSAIGEPAALCAVAIMFMVAVVVCIAITNEQRAERLTALVTAWRGGPSKRRTKAAELPSGSEDGKSSKHS